MKTRLANLFPTLAALLRDRRGASAMSFVLLLPLMLSGVAMATDYSNYRLVQTRLQAAADAAALSAVSDLKATSDQMASKAKGIIADNIPTDYGTVTKDSDITVGSYSAATGFVAGGGGAAINAVRVVAVRADSHANAVPRIFSVFLSDDDMSISATAIAARPSNVFYEPPEVKKLDSDAWDFNELYAYCYQYDTNSGSVASRRTQETLISNNSRPNVDVTTAFGGYINKPVDKAWPNCAAKGQSLSFRLRNIREANQNNSKIKTNPEYNYYTDTVITDGAEVRSGTDKFQILETKLCDSASKCDPQGLDSIVKPLWATNGDPDIETKACEPGKYMYFGWEDRPPRDANGNAIGGSDKDYNDITIQMRCPKNGKLGDNAPRLVS